MPESHSTTPEASGKPAKPYPDFPLTAHPTRRWCKKIKGKLHCFGRWEDPEGALREYQAFIVGEVVERSTTSHNPKGNSNRPNKPYPDFPLTAHPCGQWCKKIRGICTTSVRGAIPMERSRRTLNARTTFTLDAHLDRAPAQPQSNVWRTLSLSTR